jgi:hypothetical protein
MANDFSITIPNLPQLQEAFASAPDIATPILQKAVAQSQAVIDKYKKADMPWRTGMLQGNWQFTQTGLSASYAPLQAYAPFVEFGTGVYGPTGSRIYPTNKRALANVKGGWGPFRSIAGQKANPFMERLVASASGDVAGIFSQALDLINEKIASQTNG